MFSTCTWQGEAGDDAAGGEGEVSLRGIHASQVSHPDRLVFPHFYYAKLCMFVARVSAPRLASPLSLRGLRSPCLAASFALLLLLCCSCVGGPLGCSSLIIVGVYFFGLEKKVRFRFCLVFLLVGSFFSFALSLQVRQGNRSFFSSP